MENNEKVLNPQESLRVIRETIDLAKSGVRENGFHFLLWGWLVVAACLAEYYLLVSGAGPKAHMTWLLLPAIGVPATFVYEWRRDKKTKSRNVVRDWYGYLWFGFLICMFLGLVLAFRIQAPPVPMVLIPAGFATFMSGIMLRFRPLVFGGMALWLGTVACFFTPVILHGLIEAGAIGLGYLVPGYMLNLKARNSHV